MKEDIETLLELIKPFVDIKYLPTIKSALESAFFSGKVEGQKEAIRILNGEEIIK